MKMAGFNQEIGGAMSEDFLLLPTLVEIANKRFDGHLVVIKFTTNWRVGFSVDDEIAKLSVGKTFAEAATEALVRVTARKA